MTEWRPVAGYHGYEVSDGGQVRSLDRSDSVGRRVRGRVLNPGVGSSGYPVVSLCDGGKHSAHVHKLVAAAFIGPCPPGLEVRHRVADKTRNGVENLHYGTKSENAQDRVQHGNDAHARQTHCVRGHEFTTENTRVHNRKRHCRECARMRKRGQL